MIVMVMLMWVPFAMDEQADSEAVERCDPRQSSVPCDVARDRLCQHTSAGLISH